LALDLAEVARLVELLRLRMVSVVVALTVDSPGEVGTISRDSASFLESHNADELLVKFTSSIMQAIDGPHVRLVYLVILADFGVAQV